MRIFQVVGYKNSGKTTLVSNLIERLVDNGFLVAALKHHGHGGLPEGFENTDSEKHRQSGAVISGVEAEGVLQLSNQKAWNMEEIIALYQVMRVDILMVEGYKNHPFDKVVLINREEDLALVNKVSNIQAVITSINLNPSIFSFPVFRRDNIIEFYEWFLEEMKKET